MSLPLYSPPLDQVTTAVLELLRGTGRTVWDGAYGGDPAQPAYPYGVLYRLTGGNSDPLPDLDADGDEVTVAYQVTAVSNLRNQCENTGVRFRDRVLARNTDGWVYGIAVPAGWQVIDRRPDPALPGIDRAGDPPRAVYSLPFRFALTIAPA